MASTQPKAGAPAVTSSPKLTPADDESSGEDSDPNSTPNNQPRSKPPLATPSSAAPTAAAPADSKAAAEAAAKANAELAAAARAARVREEAERDAKERAAKSAHFHALLTKCPALTPANALSTVPGLFFVPQFLTPAEEAAAFAECIKYKGSSTLR